MDNYRFKMNKILKGKTDNMYYQIIRYTLVGGFAFIADFSILFILTEYVGLHYLLSAAISFTLGLTINYILSIFWVFERRAVNSKFWEFFIFAIIGLIGLGFNEFFMWILTDVVFLHYLVSKMITTFIVYFWNFFARKIMLFSKRRT